MLNFGQCIYRFIVLLNNTNILECFQTHYLFITINFNVNLPFRVFVSMSQISHYYFSIHTTKT